MRHKCVFHVYTWAPPPRYLIVYMHVSKSKMPQVFCIRKTVIVNKIYQMLGMCQFSNLANHSKLSSLNQQVTVCVVLCVGCMVLLVPVGMLIELDSQSSILMCLNLVLSCSRVCLGFFTVW